MSRIFVLSSCRDAWVMTFRGLCGAIPVFKPHQGYELISPTVARLGRFRSTIPFGSAHGVHGLLRRDAAVMTRVVSLSILEVA